MKLVSHRPYPQLTSLCSLFILDWYSLKSYSFAPSLPLSVGEIHGRRNNLVRVISHWEETVRKKCFSFLKVHLAQQMWTSFIIKLHYILTGFVSVFANLTTT